MKLDKLAKYSLVAAFLTLGTNSLSTASGAAFAFGLGLKPAPAQPVDGTTVSTPQVDAAVKRVDTAKTNLDLAHKRLDAAKALLKAAEAEFKAAKTDKDALVLNTEAQQLADASGLPKNGENAPTTTAPANSAAPVASPVYNTNESTIDYSGQGAPAPSAQ